MNYPYFVSRIKAEEHLFWVAKSQVLKGCVGQGETMEEAVCELEGNEQEWLKTAQKYNIPIPSVPTEDVQAYSGKLSLRMAPAVHKEAAELAKAQGISMNQYINDAIVYQNARYSIPREARKIV